MTEQIQANFRIAAGAVRAFWGRVAGNRHLVASARVEQLAGEAALACVRARSRCVDRGLPSAGA
ncbi:CsbD family protein [Ancylobacter dichloromethanicus]|uniref:Uncharacterized protein n=1 Tax=Ancylobacter dichloromethanicus TaxID=518825 RepID=A0A9W6J9A9_9HYPH|nr:CsbD family protein [Ancylobacter dichloromethanicus]MBS7554530.1 CsbD family protein [Ancylobacter dichloromethanicus]GLK71660.1 hypothetical protein GCM10017643_17750 [Ancylobacter dichloromethanicus]